MIFAQTQKAGPFSSWSLLEAAAQVISKYSLLFLDRILISLGFNPENFPGGESGRGLLVFLLLIFTVGGVIWMLGRWLRGLTRPAQALQNHVTLSVLNSGIRPLSMVIWVYGGFIALAPLLVVLGTKEQRSPALAFASFLFSAFTVVALVWFTLNLLIHMKRWVSQWSLKNESPLDKVLIPLIFRSAQVLIPLLAIVLFLNVVDFPDAFESFLGKLVSILVIVSVSWVAIQLVLTFDDIILVKIRLDDPDNLRARTIFTQVSVIQRVGLVLIGIISLASILLLFPEVRQFGQTILASAGVAGIIIGIALQHTLANLFAGIQIAFTQPIRLDDAVIVENEWGWIEEITLTYVVVKIWDWRRLVLPISYFIEKPFQNWTRTSSSIIGSVYLYVDYRTPISELREAFESLVKKHPLWDGQVYRLHVTECKQNTVELRIIVSAASSPKAWDLRCNLREAFIAHIQKHYPTCLPQVRLEPLSPIEIQASGEPQAQPAS